MKLLWPTLIIILSFTVMALLASFGGRAHPNEEEPSTRMTTGTRRVSAGRRYYDQHHHSAL